MIEFKLSMHSFRRFVLALAVSGLLLVAPAATRAQAISNADLVNKPADKPFVAVGFDRPFYPSAEPDVLNPANYSVNLVRKGQVTRDLTVSQVTLDPDEEGGPTTLRVFLLPPVDVIKGDTITVVYFGSTLGKKEVKVPLSKAVAFKAPGGNGLNGGGGGGSPKLEGAEGRKDANLYFAGELNRASGTSFSGSLDMKVELPLPVLRTPRHQLLPTLDIKASNDPEADPDTIKAGVESRLILAQAGVEYHRNSPEKALIKAVGWDNSAKIEGDRDFDNTNFIASSVFQFPLKPIHLGSPSPDHPFIGLTPFVGFEGGKNLSSPVAEAKGRGLARILVGSHIFVRFYHGEEKFARVTLDGGYERRWPLLAEIGFRDKTVEVENGKDETIQVPAFFGKGPRQWAEAKLTYNINEFFGLYTGYQYGEQPPAYKLVDHSFRLGLVVKAKFKSKE
jgi:hypothetical protein